MIIKELQKMRACRASIAKKLDALEKSGMTPDQLDEFNSLCKQEFELTVKERLLDLRPDGSLQTIIPPSIARRVKLIPMVVKNP